MANYYEKILKDIEKLVDEKDYKEAMIIIDDELEQPYSPEDFEKKILEIRKDITIHMEESTDRNPKSGLIQKLFSKEFHERLHAIVALSEFEFDTLDLDLIFVFLTHEKTNFLKTLMMELLIEQAVDKEFILHWEDQIMHINPSQEQPIRNKYHSKKTEKLIDDMTSQEPSITKMSNDVLNSLIMYMYPMNIYWSYTEIAQSCVRYCKYTMGDIDKDDSEVSIYIEKALKDMNNLVE